VIAATAEVQRVVIGDASAVDVDGQAEGGDVGIAGEDGGNLAAGQAGTAGRALGGLQRRVRALGYLDAEHQLVHADGARGPGQAVEAEHCRVDVGKADVGHDGRVQRRVGTVPGGVGRAGGAGGNHGAGAVGGAQGGGAGELDLGEVGIAGRKVRIDAVAGA